MGEAKRRGTFQERKDLRQSKILKELTENMIDFSDQNMSYLKLGYEFLRDKLHPNDWLKRKQEIIEYLKDRPLDYSSPNGKIRFTTDETSWYIFLCEEFFRNPLLTNPSQISRIAPWIISLGKSVSDLKKIEGIENKLKDLVKKYKGNPDGTLFELLVAATYLKQGYSVEFLEENNLKTPDMRVFKGEENFYVECKKLQRRTDYAEKERNLFLKSWDESKKILLKNYPNYWFFLEIKTELVDNEVINLIEKFDRLSEEGDILSYEDSEVALIGKKRDLYKINNYLQANYVKMESFTFSKLLGEEYVYSNADRTHILIMQPNILEVASAPVLGLFVNKLGKFLGVTRIFTNENSQNKKSKEVLKQVKEALDQLENYQNRVVHVLYEALEDPVVELKRWGKIEDKMKELEKELPADISIKIHNLTYYEDVNQMFDVQETIKSWGKRVPFSPFIIK
ncbi:hypothetical protein R4529_05210 [Acinetobacter baumannii]|nr:hypothetical protein [Acinetobacter baumannii]